MSNAGDELLDFSINDEDEEVYYTEIPEGVDNAAVCSVCKHVVGGVTSAMRNTQSVAKAKGLVNS